MSSTRFRTMRRRAYTRAIEALVQRHPWLEGQVIEPAPGHLDVLTNFLDQCERLIRPIHLNHPPQVCISSPQEKLVMRVLVKHASGEWQMALSDIMEQAMFTARQRCPVCGAPVSIDGTRMFHQGQRCSAHEELIGLFTEDIFRGRKKAQADLAEVLGGEHGADSQDIDSSQLEASPIANPAGTGVADADGGVLSSPRIKLFDLTGLKTHVDRHRAKNDEKFRRAQAMAERMQKAGDEWRTLGVLSQDWAPQMDEFERDFPNFSALADLLRDHFALSALGDRRVAWPPVLLVGPAGIGKTEAARWLADQLALPFQVFDMASAQSGSPLAGSEAFWSNSEPGQLFELLAYERQANPVVVLDELDKAGGNRSKTYDPLAALYTLLEQRSARAFIDLSIRDFAIDASHVNWMATANSLESIPVPILSRFTVLHISAPEPDQVAHIAQQIYVRLCGEASWGSAFPDALDAAVLNRLRALPPRALSQSLRRALGRAARAGRAHVTVDDVPAFIPVTRRGIGFLTEVAK